MTEPITCPRCGGSGEFDYAAYKGTSVDPNEVRAAKYALRDAYALEHRLPETPSTEDIVVALAKELSDVDLEDAPRRI